MFFNQRKRIGNAYTQCGRIANSPERPVAGCFLIRESALEMLILSAEELQIRPNGEKGVPLRGRNLANRSKSCKSVLPRKGRKRCWLISNPKKCIGNAYTQNGRIANSPERGLNGDFSRLWRDIFQIYVNHSNLFSIFVPLLRHVFNNDCLGDCH